MSVALLREMFDRMVIPKNADLIEQYYHPEFVMFSDGLRQDFAEYAASHRGVYATEIRYSIEYDDDAWVETPDKVAGHLWITTVRPGEQPTLSHALNPHHPSNGRLYGQMPWRRRRRFNR